jgi:hypothetical protein
MKVFKMHLCCKPVFFAKSKGVVIFFAIASDWGLVCILKQNKEMPSVLGGFRWLERIEGAARYALFDDAL